MRKGFIEAGYPQAWLKAVDLQPNDGSSITAAQQQIAPAVENLLSTAQAAAKRAGCTAPRKIDIIAHSMGAVSSRWYVARIEASRVSNLVGVAPANHGSDALCDLEGEGNAELCPAFDEDTTRRGLQTQLNGTSAHPADETPFGPGADREGVQTVPPQAPRRVRYTTFRLDPDEWIRPARSAVLDGAGGLRLQNLVEDAVITTPGNVLWPAGTAHDDLPKDPRLINVIVTSLQQDLSE